MSLKLPTPGKEPATEKQLAWLKEHQYYGTMQLTLKEAATLITEIMEQERIARPRNEQDYFKMIKRING